MRLVALFLFLGLGAIGAAEARAENGLQFMYERSEVTLVRSKPPLPQPSLPWLPAPPQEPPAVTLNVEVRDGASLYNQKGWYNLSGPADNSGVLLAFSEPEMAPIVRSTEFAPLDILFIDSEGKITQIIPNLKLSELKEQIVPQQPVRAFMFLKGGSAQTLSITPGDTVQYPLFKKSPVVVGARQAVVPVKPLTAQTADEILDSDEFGKISPSAGAVTKKEPTDSPIK